MRTRSPGARTPHRGSALLELAIAIPILLLVILWSRHLVDITLLRLAADEAARYAAWELAAGQATPSIQRDVQRRFVDLSSPRSHDHRAPAGTATLPAVEVSEVRLGRRLLAPTDGRTGSGPDSSVISQLAGQPVDHAMRFLGFDTRGSVSARVTLKVAKPLVPAVLLLGADGREDDKTTKEPSADGKAAASKALTVTATAPRMLVDSWRAWPGPDAVASQDISTSPYRTYGKGSAPEQEVAARLKGAAFAGLQSGPFAVVDRTISSLLGMLSLPSPLQTGTWAEGGPVVMLPGAPARQRFSPAAGQPLQRGGGFTTPSDRLTPILAETPLHRPDRLRASGVAAALHTAEWTADGGTARREPPSADPNPATSAYRCRDAWFMGATRPGLRRFGRTFNQWAAEAHPHCAQETR